MTAAELRLLPLLSTHLTAAEIATELYLSPHTIKSQMQSAYRKLDSSTRSQAITRARNWDCWKGKARLYPHRGDETRPGMSCDGVMTGQVHDQAAGLQEMLRKLAMLHEGFARDKARLELDLAGTSALDPRRPR